MRDQARAPLRPSATAGRERYHVLSAYGSFHGRTLTTLAATGQPQKQETFQPLPAGFRQVLFDDLDALASALDERVAAVMLEPVQGEGGREPRRARVPARRAPSSATSARRCSSSTRCRPDSAAPAGGSVSSTAASGPTSSRWPRRSATACRSARVGRAPTSPPRSSPATTRRRSAASRSRRAPRSPCSTSWSASRCPTRANAAGARLADALGRSPTCRGGARRRPAARGRTRRRRHRRQGRRAALPRRGSRRQRGDAECAAARAVAARLRRRDRRRGRDPHDVLAATPAEVGS